MKILDNGFKISLLKLILLLVVCKTRSSTQSDTKSARPGQCQMLASASKCTSEHHQYKIAGGSALFAPGCPPHRGQSTGSAAEQRRWSVERLLLKGTYRGHTLGPKGGGRSGSLNVNYESTLSAAGVFFFFFFSPQIIKKKHIQDKEERHVEACLQLSAAPL